MNDKLNVLDHGHIMLLDMMGDDNAIIEAARTSYQKETRHISDNRTLMRFLLRHDHASPFESVVLKFHVKLPIFVERQWARHRTAGWNEVSARYSVLPEETYRPAPENVEAQSKNNKQGRNEPVPAEVLEEFYMGLDMVGDLAFENYRRDLDAGVSRELARIQLPLSTYTEKVWWCNLRNIFNFLRLRMASNAQYEIRMYANAMAEIVKQLFPVAYEAFEDYVLHAKTFSRMEMELVKNCIPNPSNLPKPDSMTDREWKEFLEKLA